MKNINHFSFILTLTLYILEDDTQHYRVAELVSECCIIIFLIENFYNFFILNTFFIFTMKNAKNLFYIKITISNSNKA